MTKVVLIKSESEGEDKFVKELEKNDFVVETITSIDFVYKNINLLFEKLSMSNEYDGMIFTSPRAVNALEKVDKLLLNEWKVKKFNYSVGESTAKLVEKLLDIETKGSEAGNAQKLSELIINDYCDKTDMKKKLLFPCSSLKQDILGKNLKAQSIDLDIIEVYETIQHPALENSIKNLTKIDFIVFFSPSSVNFLLPIFSKHKIDLNDVKIIAIGPSTEKCLNTCNIECSEKCEKPSPVCLVNVIQKLCSK